MATNRKYPLAAVAWYGPDDSRATKLVLSIYRRPNDPNPEAMYRWSVADGDVRTDRSIAADVEAMKAQHRVRHTVTSPHIIGCPHEEGVDYPLGRVCPHCPFWTTRDRWTLEPIAPPTTSMSVAEVLAALSFPAPVDPPFDALEAAEALREALTGPLLESVEACLAAPLTVPDGQAMRSSYALYLLAKWREPRAYPLVLRWLSLPGEEAFDLYGEIVTWDGGRILASVCDGDLDPITALVLNREANEWCRAAGVRALALLGAWAEVPAEQIVEHLTWLASEGLEREPGAVWDELASSSADIEAVPVFPALRRAYAEGLIDSVHVNPTALDKVEAAPPGEMLEAIQDGYPPYDDVATAVSWWSCFDTAHTHGASDIPDHGEPVEPYRAPAKVGRNEPCSCGSGKKFKKCCGA